ncbi:DUF3822 family protein [Gaetbulibacter aestuarii]|uniref:DUF3822 family protein n=1 Tax=Gaetbulibacter aestuarii TaxID=1502358 RepID=A0ABW7N0N3_9FLAO
MAITNKNINKNNNLTNKELSIQLSLNGLSFCILNRNNQTVITLKDIPFEKKLNPLELLDKLKHVVNTNEDLQHAFDQVIVIHDNELSSLVPKALFKEEFKADYLKFNTKILKSDFIAHDTIKINDSVCVYVPYVNINNYLYDLYGEFVYKHAATVLIESILKLEKNQDKLNFYVNVHVSHFEIVVVEKAKLILYNRFEYNTKEDFIYYILFAAEQLGLNPETLNLIFLGKINKDSPLYIITFKYVRFVFLGRREDAFKYSLEAQPEDHHTNFTLIKSL